MSAQAGRGSHSASRREFPSLVRAAVGGPLVDRGAAGGRGSVDVEPVPVGAGFDGVGAVAEWCDQPLLVGAPGRVPEIELGAWPGIDVGDVQSLAAADTGDG